MKLKAFRIQNFRSIVDTDFQDLSPDNISAIIGQNESGKTSILEALTAFNSNEVTVDDIRNNNSSPVVTCIFSVEDGETKKLFEDDYEIPQDLEKTIKSLDHCIALKKTWNAANVSEDPALEIENTELKTYFDSLIEEEDTKVKPGINPESITSESEDAEVLEALTAENFAKEIYEHTPIITLFEDKSLLPSTIDIEDLKNKNKEARGYTGAWNFLSLTKLTQEELANHQENKRLIKDKIDDANLNISNEFQEFWSQILGTRDKISIQVAIGNYDEKIPNKTGKPYLEFWIKDNNGSLRPVQRSMGVRWFISFFLTLKATAKENRDRIMLIDEAGANLHAKAQADILKILESEKDNLQIVYATHSPYLLNVDKVYRVIAVEKEEVDGNKTVTKVHKFHELGSASADTLFPLYTNMGVDISHQQVIQKSDNVLLEEISAFFYLKAFWKLFGKRKKLIFYLPQVVRISPH